MINRGFSADEAEAVEPRPQQLLDAVVGELVEASGGQAGLISLWDDRQQRLSYTSAVGLDSEALRQLQPTISQLIEQVGTQGPPELAASLDADSLAATERLGLGRLHALALPLAHQGHVVGLLCLFHNGGPAVQPDPPKVYDLIINRVDLVVQSARLIQRLIEEKRWLEAVVQHSADGILIVDRDGHILAFNPALERLSGWRAPEVRGRPYDAVFRLRDGVRGQRAPRTALALRQALFGWEPIDGTPAARELMLLRRDGTWVDVEVTGSEIRSEAGEVLGAVMGLRDITARRQAQELQSTFLSVISHELQTPIAIIKGYAGLLSERAPDLDPEQLQQRLAIIQEESERLAAMVDKLLYASRLQAGGLELRRETLDIGVLVHRVVQRMAAVSRTHRVEAVVPRHLPPVLADYERLQEVLVNLIDNAIKYSPGGGRITVSVEADSRLVTVSVTDEGIGIQPEDRQRIFERFARTAGASGQAKGTGLGLFISKAIVEAHGGRIWVEPARGQGSCFRFSLARERAADQPARLQGGS